MNDLIIDIGLVLIIATILAIIARRLAQPIIVGYLVAGILMGPAGFGLVTNSETIAFLSELGVVFLLFIVGLEINLKRIKGAGTAALLVGLLQVLLTFAAGFALARFLGFNSVTASYIAIILTLSSTVTVIKLYGDKHELNTLHGRVALAILLVQDLVAIIALSLLATQETSTWSFSTILVGIGGLLTIAVLSKLFLDRLFTLVSRWPELLYITSIAWCFLFVIAAQLLGISTAIAALLAGISLSPLLVHHEISARIRPLRDFFATLFFVSIGMTITFSGTSATLIGILALFVILVCPLLIMTVMSIIGFKAKPSFLTSIGLGQISEFSLIIAGAGVQAGLINIEILSITALLAVITFVSSSYFITYDTTVYSRFSRVLRQFEKLGIRHLRLQYGNTSPKPEYIIFGAHRMGMRIINTLRSMKKKVFVVDHDPQVIKKLMKKRIPCRYGDIEDPHIMEQIGIHHAKMVISTIPRFEDNLLLIQRVTVLNPQAAIIVTADHEHEGLQHYEHGAHYVILPQVLSGKHVSTLMQDPISAVIKRKTKYHNALHRAKNNKQRGTHNTYDHRK
ncbi:hypothetical protein GF342_02545 [Candidatus Woesearchaeota archaeon]|nr:hypothetical protein [Candidatus Woesearchaeota archaeon]